MLKAVTKLLAAHFLPMAEVSPLAQLRRGTATREGLFQHERETSTGHGGALTSQPRATLLLDNQVTTETFGILTTRL